jgi:hypothetical protein
MGSQVHRPAFQVEIGVWLSEVVRQCVDDDQLDLRYEWLIRYQSEDLHIASFTQRPTLSCSLNHDSIV